jgi:hypothetical protein
LEGTLEVVKLLYRLEAFGMELIAACAEEILDEVAILESIVHYNH